MNPANFIYSTEIIAFAYLVFSSDSFILNNALIHFDDLQFLLRTKEKFRFLIGQRASLTCFQNIYHLHSHTA